MNEPKPILEKYTQAMRDLFPMNEVAFNKKTWTAVIIATASRKFVIQVEDLISFFHLPFYTINQILDIPVDHRMVNILLTYADLPYPSDERMVAA